MATVNTNDEKLLQYENTKNNLINEAQTNYNQVSSGAEQKYNELIKATEDYGKQQAEITQAQTNQVITEINQNKDKAEKDYIKEQKSAYADYAMQTNEYGVNAEKVASAGLQGSGYSESSKVNMYNTYQNRYATARESYNQVVMGYDNQIAQAKLQNSAQLAEIAFNTLQQGLGLAIESFQYKNELLNNLLNQKLSITSTYDNLWQSRYNSLLNEAQFNEQMAYQKQRDAVADSQWQQQFNLSRAKASGSGGGTFSSGGGSGSNAKMSGGSLTMDVSKEVAKYKKTEPTGLADNEANKHIAWRDGVAKDIQNRTDLNEDEKRQIISDLNLFAGNYGRGGSNHGGR